MVDSTGMLIFFFAILTASIPIIAPGMPIITRIIANVSANSGSKEYPGNLLVFFISGLLKYNGIFSGYSSNPKAAFLISFSVIESSISPITPIFCFPINISNEFSLNAV